jgi:prepilin-type N-terminal cleavage/methylation domain-containing protein
MKHGNKRGARGFSAIELLIVIAVVLVLGGIALPQIVTITQTFRGDSAGSDLMSRLRSARETAIASRRYIQVTFVGGNQLQFFVISASNGPPAPVYVNPVALASGGQFLVFPGIPDTPMQFGNAAPIYINGQSGGPLTMYFSPNGSFVGPNFTPISGTVFVGIPNMKNTAHAVTIVGGTGRVRLYTYTGTQWIE